MSPRIFWACSAGMLVSLALAPGAAVAQIVPDNTLGQESSQIMPDAIVRDLPASLIEGGAIRGSNLFHSFSEFNVNELQRVYFANPDNITDILSRVTGNNPSDILGTLGVDGGANLFLLNPQGIFFGPDAQLDIAGSFTASTGDAWVLGEGEYFSAVNPGGAPLLVTNITPGIQYSPAQRAIESQAALTAGDNLTLAAGTLSLEGQLQAGGNLDLLATNTLTIRDDVSEPFIAAAGNDLLLQGDESVDIFALNHPDSGLFAGGDFTIRSNNDVIGDAYYSGSGNFVLESLNINRPIRLISPNDPVFQFDGDIVLPGYTGTSLHVLAGGSVLVTNDIVITGAGDGLVGTVQLSDGTLLAINGDINPTVDIRAGLNPNQASADIAVGNIANSFVGSLVYLSNADSVAPSASISTGSIDVFGGEVVIDARDNLLVDGGINVSINDGDGGDIRLFSTTGRIDSLNGQLTAGSDNGDGGDILLVAEEGVFTDEIRSFVSPDGVGDGGNIQIVSRSGEIDVGNIESFVGLNGIGDGGNITLDANGDITIRDNSEINSTGLLGGDITLISNGTISASQAQISSNNVSPDPIPGEDGGSIFIAARNLELTDRTLITNSTIPLALTQAFILSGIAPQPDNLIAEVDAGDINIIVEETFLLSGDSSIRGLIESGGIGRAADISIQAASVIVDESQIGSALFRAQNFNGIDLPGGAGSGGDIEIIARDSVILSGTNDNGFSAGLLTLTEQGANGPAGDVFIQANELLIEDGAVISSLTFNENDAGIIAIDVEELSVIDGGKILANTFGDGSAGGIFVEANEIIISGRDQDYEARIATIEEYIANFEPDLTAEEVVGIDLFTGENSGLFVSSSRLPDDLDSGGASDFSTFDPNNQLGQAGLVLLLAENVEMDSGGFISAVTFTEADGGTIALFVQDLNLTGGAEILSLTTGSGAAGDVFLFPLDENRPSSASISGFEPLESSDPAEVFDFLGNPVGGFSSGLFAGSEGLGEGGNVFVEGIDDLSISDGGVINNRTRDSSSPTGENRGGDIFINIDTLDLTEGGQIISSTYGTGEAGDIVINVESDANFSGIDDNRITRLGNLEAAWADVRPDLDPTEQALRTIDTVRESSGIFSTVENGATNDGGDITFTVGGSLFMDEFSQIAVGTSGVGDAGSITVDIEESLDLAGGSTIRALVESRGIGNGGDINIEANSVSLTEGSQISASIFRETVANDGSIIPGGNADRAGNIVITADTDVTLSGRGVDITNTGLFRSALLVSTESGASGEAGSIRVNAETLNILNGGLITARTDNESDAGSIELNIEDSLFLTGGNLTDDYSTIEVQSSQPGSNPGNILIASDLPEDFIDFTDPNFFSEITPNSYQSLSFIDFSNGGRIRATTESGQNANIVIFSDFIDMRQPDSVPQAALIGDLESCDACNNISTTALGNQGNGGNIFIGTLAGIRANLDDNSDIVADARGQGTGGNIVIGSLASSFLGTGSRTSTSRLAFEFIEGQEPTNQSDLFASSRLGQDGTTAVDGQENVQELPPIDLVDPIGLIDRRCELTARNSDSQFVVTGRGGIPADPTDQLSEGELLEDLGPETVVNQNTVTTPTETVAQSPDYVVEAQGWSVDENGDYWLVAGVPEIQVAQHPMEISCSAEAASSSN